MVTSIVYPNGESRLAILLDKYEDVEGVLKVKSDLLGLLGLAVECQTEVNRYLGSIAYLLELLEVGTGSFQMNKATRVLLDNEALRVSAFPNDGGIIAHPES